MHEHRAEQREALPKKEQGDITFPVDFFCHAASPFPLRLPMVRLWIIPMGIMSEKRIFVNFPLLALPADDLPHIGKWLDNICYIC